MFIHLFFDNRVFSIVFYSNVLYILKHKKWDKRKIQRKKQKICIFSSPYFQKRKQNFEGKLPPPMQNLKRGRKKEKKEEKNEKKGGKGEKAKTLSPIPN